MTNPDDRWLHDMMDAAVVDPADRLAGPDFGVLRRGRRTRHSPRLLAAAIVLGLAVALPLLGILGVELRDQALRRREAALFVEELIGGSLFDESWAEDLDDEFFDI